MGEHTVSSFDEDLGHLERLITGMGELAGAMVAASARALVGSDTALAQRTISDDAVMDSHQRELDERAITLIAKRQPMAQDLRLIIGAIRMAADFERIGDLAKNIAKRVSVVGDTGTPHTLAHGIEKMAGMVHAQVERVARLYVGRDAEKLAAVRAADEEIDIQYTAVFRELLTYMMEDPRNITACMHLHFIAKNVERMGDHVTSIAEQVVYLVTGEIPDEGRPKADATTEKP